MKLSGIHTVALASVLTLMGTSLDSTQGHAQTSVPTEPEIICTTDGLMDGGWEIVGSPSVSTPGNYRIRIASAGGFGGNDIFFEGEMTLTSKRVSRSGAKCELRFEGKHPTTKKKFGFLISESGEERLTAFDGQKIKKDELFTGLRCRLDPSFTSKYFGKCTK